MFSFKRRSQKAAFNVYAKEIITKAFFSSVFGLFVCLLAYHAFVFPNTICTALLFSYNSLQPFS